MKKITSRDQFYCAVLEHKDNYVYRIVNRLLWDNNSDDRWLHRLVLEPKSYCFVLFERLSETQDRLVGMGELTLERPYPLLSNGAILPELQGKNLISLIYEARYRLAAALTKASAVEVKIDDNNSCSIRAATKQGFIVDREVELDDPNDTPAHMYRRTLEDYRLGMQP